MLSHLVVVFAITFLTLIGLIAVEWRQTLDGVFYFRY